MIYQKAAELEEKGISFAVITFVVGKGHLPQEAGAKALVTSDGLHCGTIGGGKVEARAIEEGISLLKSGKTEPLLVSWNLQRDIDMTCGGEMSFLIEAHYPKQWTIVVYGAGHVAQALVRVLAGIECRVTCVDARAEWREKLPGGVIAKDWIEPALHLAEFPGNAFHVVITQDHSSDVPILAAIAKHFPHSPYVGVIGSATKAGKLRKELNELGVSAGFLEKLLCPIGLPLGDNKPGEIAVSIAAQLLQVRG
jgi:xanthine dehydrogenase accessory factor